ncbi:MAG: hypothetical protein NC548_50945 [Lachnospiraceae bacterium]|nr:hypothetical protein [Lachnospiraceae bacterium]
MSTLIRFEDRYGCRTLFEYVHRDHTLDVDITHGLDNSGVFKVTNRMIKDYDKIIVVFDLDSDKDISLTEPELKERLKSHILDNSYNIKSQYIDKVCLVPVYICYETLYLYSEEVRNTIGNIDSFGNTEPVRLVKALKKYYDYSTLNPEMTTGLQYRLQDIQLDIENITKQKKMKGLFLPQHFHKAYSKQTLKILFKDIISNNDKGDKILDKSEGTLFELLTECGRSDFIDSIIQGICSDAILNKSICKVLTVTDMDNLDIPALNEQTIRSLYDELNNYNKQMKTYILNRQERSAKRVMKDLKGTQYYKP